MQTLSKQDLQFKVKDLRKLHNRETQQSLKNYYRRELTKAKTALDNAIKNESGYVSPRSALSGAPRVKWEATS